MDTCKNVEGITRKLQTFLNINFDHITQTDVNKILNLNLPLKQVDNLIKITNHTNESLKELKTGLIKNRNLMAEEISCLNECFANTSYEADLDNSNYKSEEIFSDGARSISPSSPNNHSEIKKTNRKVDTVEARKENMLDAEYLTRKLLLETKKRRQEGLGSPPPMVHLPNLK